MWKRRGLCLVLAVLLTVALPWGTGRAYQSTTLYSGMRSEAVRTMQQALIDLGYLGGYADGIFGTNTENAVKKFQRSCGLKADGLAGLQTLQLLYSKASGGKTEETQQQQQQEQQQQQQEQQQQEQRQTTTEETRGTSSGSLFSGNYATLRQGDSGSRVKILQQALRSAGFLSGSADGRFGPMTRAAVIAFQKARGLTADGLAGKRTLTALEAYLSAGGSSGTTQTETEKTQTEATTEGTSWQGTTASIPSIGSVRLLHWFNDIKPNLKTGQTLKIVDPATGYSWTLSLYSLGRHADAEPLTAQDTATMVAAFGGKNTWNQKAVYVQLPGGAWTIGATHDMPHMSGSISDNKFDGHLCVHFLRDMDECKKKDPNYGVANQQTIRSFWYALTGVTVE